jgi:hypothetical protein
MNELIIEKEDKKGYGKRLRQDLIIICTIGFFFAILVGYGLDVAFAVLMLGVIFVILLPGVFKENRYYIHSISIRDDNVSIYYSKGNEMIRFQGKLSDMSFKKKFKIKSRRAYLKIKSNKHLLLFQYTIGDWLEGDINKVLEAAGQPLRERLW